MTHDVAIIGVGMHPFGRFEGKSAMEMAVPLSRGSLVND
jgi:acetyl-CoA C-acetyltransferase